MITILLASVISFGAVGDCVHDDRPAIQAALDSGDDVFLPRGCYRVTRAGSAYRALLVDGVNIAGDGEAATTLELAPGTAPSVRLLQVTGESPSITALTIRGRPGTDTQSHGVFATEVTGLVIADVTASGFSGDGFYLYRGAADTSLDHVTAADNGRNGLTLGATVTGVDVGFSRFAGNRAQQIDSEPGGEEVVSGVAVHDCVIDSGADFALTISGSSSAVPGHGWRVEDNEINGAVFVVWATDVRFAGNHGINRSAQPSVLIERSSARVRVLGNRLARTLPGSVVAIIGTAGSGPTDIVVAGNRLSAEAPDSYGVRVAGAVDVSILGNDITGRGGIGVYLRATVLARPFERATVTDNAVSGFEQTLLVTNDPGQLQLLDAERNGL